jgi:hypothetical protein
MARTCDLATQLPVTMPRGRPPAPCPPESVRPARQQRLLRQVVAVSAGIGIAILAAGVVAFVLAGYHWLVLALTWAFGLPHLGLLARTRRLGRRTQLLGKP